MYVHGRPKDHGLENCIEGDLRPRQKVVIIEDQVSEGKYCTKVQDALQKDGSIVMGMISIFDYELTVGQQHLKKNALQNRSLTCFNSIINYAIQSGVLSPENEEIMRMWQRAPQEWRKKK